VTRKCVWVESRLLRAAALVAGKKESLNHVQLWWAAATSGERNDQSVRRRGW
jgi:hypothetical protein